MDSIADAALSGIGIVVINFFLVLGAEGIRRFFEKFRARRFKSLK